MGLLIIRHLAKLVLQNQGEAMLFIVACYFEKDHASAIGVLYCIQNSRMMIIIIIIIISTDIKQHAQKCN